MQGVTTGRPGVYFQGRLITDLAAEPGLAAPLDAIAGNYDKYYSAAPGAVNPVVTAPRSPPELRDRIPVLMELDLALNVTYQPPAHDLLLVMPTKTMKPGGGGLLDRLRGAGSSGRAAT